MKSIKDKSEIRKPGKERNGQKKLSDFAGGTQPYDLRVTQCLFVGDEHVIPNHLGVLASGQGIVVDHCVFYQCKDAVVFWFSDEPAERCEMHHNLMIDYYGAAVWSWSVADDFKLYNNVFGKSEEMKKKYIQ